MIAVSPSLPSFFFFFSRRASVSVCLFRILESRIGRQNYLTCRRSVFGKFHL